MMKRFDTSKAQLSFECNKLTIFLSITYTI